MRGLGIMVVLLVARAAAAQPVGFELRAEVGVGQKPALRVTAVQPVTALRVELDRDDGKHFTLRHPSLGKGKSVTLSIGDGAAGKATYTGTISAQLAGQKERWSDALSFQTLVRAPLKITYDAEHLDLDKRELQFKLSRPAASAELVVIGDDGKQLATGAATYQQPAPDAWLSITWKQPAGTRVMMLKLRVVAGDGIATNLELIPWSVTVDHEDVNFRTDSAVIEAAEHGKLDASLAKIHEIVKRSERFLKLRLYIAGHTDTVGGGAKNKRLSLDRARAIASYLRKQGLRLPISFAGFGEDVLKVRTADNTDERANRRVDYVLGPAAAPPPFRGPYLRVRAAWKQLR